MATRGVAFTATFYAYDSATGAPKTGDSGNITPRLVKDGNDAALTTTTVTEVNATNLPGTYKVSISATEADCDELVVGGKSTTSGVYIVPSNYQMERLPNAAPGASGGVVLFGTGTGAINASGGRADANVTYFGGAAGTFASGRPDVNATHVAGTAQTGRDLGAVLGAWTGSGVNTVLGAFKALLSKAASTPSDIGGTFDATTDSVEALRDRGDAAWTTAVGFSTHSAADVWAVATRTLTANTNLNDPTAAAIADAVWDEAQSGHTTAGTFGKYVDSQLSTIATALTNAAADVTTILGKFTGITLLAQWLGLIAGKQTGNSTARTELRATGAGSGTYDETTDSLEAVRDRGDAAWATGSAGTIALVIGGWTRSGSTYYVAYSLLVNGAVITSGLSALSVTFLQAGTNLTFSGTPAADAGTGIVRASGTLTTAVTDNVPVMVRVAVTYNGTAYTADLPGASAT